MDKQKANKTLDIWRQCKAEALLYDPLNATNTIDFTLAKELFIKKLEGNNFQCIGEGAYKLVFFQKKR